MNIGPMSSTTEDSDWELTIIPRSRQPSSASQSSSLPKSQPAGTLQPILPKPNGPGQSVFPMTAPPNYRHPSSLNQVPYPQPHLQLVNQAPFPAPSFIAPVARPNPAVARIIQEGACKASNPLIQNPPTADVTVYGTPVTSQLPDPVQQRAVQQPAPAPVYVTPGYVAPPSKSVRGVRRGTTRGRGGRKPKIKVEAPDNGDTFTITSTPTGGRGSGRGRGRGGRVNRGGRPRGSRAGASSARGGKRKREDDDEKDDSDVSEIITVLPTQSRSGRKIIHANNFSPVVIDLEKEPPSSKTAATAKPASNAPIQPVKGKGGKRFSRPGEASVCKNCSRGHSPASNMIVFCDGCNGPWHQYCHDPPISSEVVRIEEQEWFCADCMVLREEKAHVDGKVSAETLSVVEVSLSSLHCSATAQYLNHIRSRNGAICKAFHLPSWFPYSSMPPFFIQTYQSLLHPLVGRCQKGRKGLSRTLWILQHHPKRKTKVMISIRTRRCCPIPKQAMEYHYLGKATSYLCSLMRTSGFIAMLGIGSKGALIATVTSREGGLMAQQSLHKKRMPMRPT